MDSQQKFTSQDSIAKEISEKQKEESPQQNQHKSRYPAILIIGIIGIIILLCIGIGFYLSKKQSSQQIVTTQPHIKVGVMLPFTGGASSAGLGALKGIELAKKELHATNIELIQEDSQCNDKVAAQAASHLVAKGVVAIIGEMCSRGSLGALPIANKAHVTMVSPDSSSPRLSIPNDYFFRMVPPDGQQGKFMAKLIYDKGLRRVAIIHSNEPYGNDLTKIFAENFKKLGGTVTATQQFESDDINVQPQINNVKATKPDAVYLISNGVPSATALLESMHNVGMNIPVFGADSLFDKVLINSPAAQQAAQGFTVVAFSAGTKTFKQAMADAYSANALTIHAAEAYDAFEAIYLALQKGAKTGEEIKNILPTIEFDGVSTHVKFDKNGEISDNYTYDVYQVKGSDFVLIEH